MHLSERLSTHLLVTGRASSEALAASSSLAELEDTLLDEGLILDERELLGILEELTMTEGFDPSVPDFPASRFEELAELVPPGLVLARRLFPIGKSANLLSVVLSDPTDREAIAELGFFSGCRVRPFVCHARGISRAIECHYGPGEPGALARWEAQLKRVRRVMSGAETGPVFGPVAELAARVGHAFASQERRLRSDLEALEAAACSPEVIRLLQEILNQALVRACSDIHFEPSRQGLRIRARHDGLLVTHHELPALFSELIGARLRLMAGLSLGARGTPQDARIDYSTVFERRVEYRLSAVPCLHGENLVLRVVDLGRGIPAIGALGMAAPERHRFESALKRPHGIVLVTGPTGSGKSTTIYSALESLRAASRHIISVEDPVEHAVDGITQIHVGEGTAVAIPELLRSLLRQDPDVISLGEIRDRETAEFAVKASLTGHLVISTLHTNDAASSLARLLDLGLEPFTLAAALRLVAAQRLVPILCDDCKRPLRVLPTEAVEQGLSQALAGCTLYARGGCSRCFGTGYVGRTGLFEVLPVDEKLEALILARAPAAELRRHARASGVASLREAALTLLADGRIAFSDALLAE